MKILSARLCNCGHTSKEFQSTLAYTYRMMCTFPRKRTDHKTLITEANWSERHCHIRDLDKDCWNIGERNLRVLTVGLYSFCDEVVLTTLATHITQSTYTTFCLALHGRASTSGDQPEELY